MCGYRHSLSTSLWATSAIVSERGLLRGILFAMVTHNYAWILALRNAYIYKTNADPYTGRKTVRHVAKVAYFH